MIAEIDLKFTDDAIELFRAFLEGITKYKPTLCLIKGRADGESEDRWGYGAYGPENIQTLEPEFEKQGYSLLYNISGIVVAISQPDRINELEGKIIDADEKGIVVRDKEDGI